MRRLKVGIDMDGVLADFVSSAIEETRTKFGVIVRMTDIREFKFFDTIKKVSTGSAASKRLSEMNDSDFYSTICPPGFFFNLQPYPGAIEFTKELMKYHDVIFITKTIRNNATCAWEKASWLEQHLSTDQLHYVFVGQMEDKGLIDIDILIDDDPRCLEACKSSLCIAPVRPWNTRYLSGGTYNGWIVRDLMEIPDMINDFAQIDIGNP